jgi:hypothetical protein
MSGKLCETRRFCCVLIGTPCYFQRFFDECELPL